MTDEHTVLLVVPILPAPSGNGLAMRAGMLLDALATECAVHVVVVPVAGLTGDPKWVEARARSLLVVEPVLPEGHHQHTTRQLADAELRARLEATAPLPALAAHAPPTLASSILESSPRTDIDAVLAMRLYLAPLGIRLARMLDARVVIDLDDDDGELFRSIGANEQADAFDRLARAWLPDANRMLAASPEVARAIAHRHGLDTITVVPNAVTTPDLLAEPPAAQRLLFVGNLTYEPNVLAARWLATEIFDAVRRRHPDAALELVGSYDARLADLAQLPGVTLNGAVPDVTEHYVDADVVVVPLFQGSGTRIKVLEAMAHRRPVVATTAAVAGLDLDEDSVVIAESTEDLAMAVCSLLEDPVRAAAMTERAAAIVATRYSPDVVAPIVRDAVFGP